MLTENRFYNYDDALAGVVDHLAKTPAGSIRNLSLLITDGSKSVAGYNPKLHSLAASFLDNMGNRNVERRIMAAQESFDFHIYTEQRLGKLNATVVIDSFIAGTAAGVLQVLSDTLRRMAEALNLTVGSVYLFAVEASV